MAGNTEMPAAEPLGPIHMPSSTIIPFVMSLGLFIAGFGFTDDAAVLAMAIRLVSGNLKEAHYEKARAALHLPQKPKD